jgi:hypothetical protein
MDISSPERALDEWAATWTAGDLERVAALFTDDCVYEDVAMGTMNRGRDELRTLQGGAVLAGTPHVQIMLTSRFVGGQCGAMEWILSGSREVETSGLPLQGKEFYCPRCQRGPVPRRPDGSLLRLLGLRRLRAELRPRVVALRPPPRERREDDQMNGSLSLPLWLPRP